MSAITALFEITSPPLLELEEFDEELLVDELLDELPVELDELAALLAEELELLEPLPPSPLELDELPFPDVELFEEPLLDDDEPSPPIPKSGRRILPVFTGAGGLGGNAFELVSVCTPHAARATTEARIAFVARR